MVRPGDVLGDVAGVGGNGCPVVAGCVRDVHAGQLADHRLVLEDGLQDALTHLRLVRRVCRQELAAREHRVHHRRNVVVVHPRPEERELLRDGDVLRRQLGEVLDELLLRKRRLQGEGTVEAEALRDVSEELVHGRDADRFEHRLAVGVREGEVAHSESSSL